jgi:hypothetical protein
MAYLFLVGPPTDIGGHMNDHEGDLR